MERNSPKLLSLLLSYEANPETKHSAFKLPVLAYAVVYGHREAIDTTELVRILLAAGVNPRIIPVDMWQDFLKEPQSPYLRQAKEAGEDL